MLGVGRVTGEFIKGTTYVVNEAEGIGDSLRELKVSASSFVKLLNSTRVAPQPCVSTSLDELLRSRLLSFSLFFSPSRCCQPPRRILL